MPTHFHFLVQPKEGFSNDYIEAQMAKLQMSYTKAINKRFNRHGSLWQKRFRRVLQREDFWIMRTLAYIHHNPIHHGNALAYEDWNYTSYHNYISDIESLYAWLVKSPALNWFSENQENSKRLFIEYHETYKHNFIRRDYEKDELF